MCGFDLLHDQAVPKDVSKSQERQVSHSVQNRYKIIILNLFLIQVLNRSKTVKLWRE